MTVRKIDTPIVPSTLMISTMSEIIAPIVNIIASALISFSRRFAKRRDDGLANSAAIPAPHVALVMVPGNFVTGPFTRR